MADTLNEKGQSEPEMLFGTADEFQQRIKNEPGFYRTFQKAMDEGRVVYGSKPEAAPEPAPVEVPQESVEEEITVKIKKADLGKYSSVGDVYKAAEAKENYIKTLEAQIKELNKQQVANPVVDNRIEIEKLRKEKEELEKKISEPPK